MQVVINIDDEDYERLKEYEKAPFNSLTSRAYEAVANGTVIPKGHGRKAVMNGTGGEKNEASPTGEEANT